MTGTQGRTHNEVVNYQLQIISTDWSSHWDDDRGIVITNKGYAVAHSRSARWLTGFIAGLACGSYEPGKALPSEVVAGR
jgi:hypothetical protein